MSEPQAVKNLQTHQIDCYIEKRAAFPVEELAKHAGNWVAFSPDGSHILDSCKSLAQLQKRLADLHTDIETVVFEQVPAEDSIFSGSEFS